MKRITTLVILLTCSAAAMAQVNLRKKIADSTCACLVATPNIEKKTQDEMQALVSSCMLKKSMNDFMDLAKEENIEMTDGDAIQKLGMEIGMELAKSDCKVLKDMMMKIAQEGVAEPKTTTKFSTGSQVSATVQKVDVQDFVYITVKSDARALQLVWSDVVENGDDYVKNLAGLKDKKLTFDYQVKEVYSVKSKAYIIVNMITAVK